MKEKLDLTLLNASTLTKEQEDALFYHVDIDEQESEHLAAEPYSYCSSFYRCLSSHYLLQVVLMNPI